MRAVIYLLFLYAVLFGVIPDLQRRFWGGGAGPETVRAVILAVQVLVIFRLATYVKSRAIEAPRNFVHVFFLIGCITVFEFALLGWFVDAVNLVTEGRAVMIPGVFWLSLLRDGAWHVFSVAAGVTVFVCEWPGLWAAVPRIRPAHRS